MMFVGLSVPPARLSYTPVEAQTFRPVLSGAAFQRRDRVLREVSELHDVSIADLMGEGRSRHLVWARQEAMFRLYVDARLRAGPIGRIFSRDHSTIYHGIRAHARRAGVVSPL
jgi:chromosomal replication initiation ATPase DnaA